MNTNVLSRLTTAGYDPKRVPYGKLKKLFPGSVEWLHNRCHEGGSASTFTVARPLNPEEGLHFEIMTQLLQNDYLRGIVEGRLSRCGDDHHEHQATFSATPDLITISVETISKK